MKLYKKLADWVKGRVQYEEFEYDPEYIDRMAATAVAYRRQESITAFKINNNEKLIKIARLEKKRQQKVC